VSDWQRIETALKDGTHVLVAETIAGYPTLVCEAWFDADSSNGDGAWWPANVHPTDYVAEPLFPSHWMPLPDAPAQPVEEK
jgi:hypothetical protein